MSRKIWVNFTFVVLMIMQICFSDSQAPQADPDYTKQQQWKGACNVGSRQSPINIITNDAKMCPYNRQFQYNYTNAKINVHPFGKNLKSIFSQQTFVKFLKNQLDTQYYSAQFHWHTPSQHAINDKHYDLQFHIVHTSKTDNQQFAVISLLFNQDLSIQRDIFDEIDFIDDSKKAYPFLFKLDNQYVYNYQGSITTPLCDQSAEWFIFVNIFKIRPQNLKRFKETINGGTDNARKIQNLNDRQVSIIGGYCNMYYISN